VAELAIGQLDMGRRNSMAQIGHGQFAYRPGVTRLLLEGPYCSTAVQL